jgi:NhaP-type Na+/H+ or K+/H+ antiporter
VAVAMALSLPGDIPQRALLQEITFGVVLFTLLVQGTTVGWVVDRAIGAPTTDDTSAGESTGEAPAGEATGEAPA